VNIAFLSIITKLTSFTISASKHGKQLLNQILVYLEDITPSLGYLKTRNIFNMAAATLTLKIFSRTPIQGI